MDNENCDAHHDRALAMLVPKMVLLAAVMGMGACARRRHRRHLLEGSPGHDGHEMRGDGGHGDHRGCGGCGHRHGGRHGGFHEGPASSKNTPQRILEKRFASGEIDEDEFRRRRSVLQEND